MTSLDLYRFPQEVNGGFVKGRSDDYGNICTVPPADGYPKHNMLTIAGDGVTYNCNGDYSSALTRAYWEVPTGGRMEVVSMLLALSDDTKFTQTGWGGHATALTNGLSFWRYVKAYNTEIQLVKLLTVKRNLDWYSLTSHVVSSEFSLTPQTLSIKIPMMEKFGRYFTLEEGDRFVVRLNDDLSVLTNFTMSIAGILYGPASLMLI